MLDLHTHVIPAVDDGSDIIGTSLSMLRTAREDGVTVVAATPHFDRASGYANYASDELESSFLRLKYEAEGMGVRLVRGMEIMADEDVPDLLDEGLLWTLEGTKYFLTEFRFEEDPEYCMRYLSLCLGRGYMPVIAHPERYMFIQRDPQIAYRWCRTGCGLQINRGSLLGRFGEQARLTAMRLISHGLAALVSSDAHGTHRRTARLADARDLVSEEFGGDFAHLLFTRNPSRILEGKELLGFEPFPFN